MSDKHGPGADFPTAEITREQSEIEADIIAASDMIELPVLAGPDETGLVLTVQSIGIEGMGVFDGTGVIFLKCGDGTVYRLPETLRQLASDLIVMHLAARQAGHPSMFPCRMEFGVLNGQVFADLT